MLNFDLSQLDKLPESAKTKKGSKFQPKFLGKPRAAPTAVQGSTSQPSATPQQDELEKEPAVPSQTQPDQPTAKEAPEQAPSTQHPSQLPVQQDSQKAAAVEKRDVEAEVVEQPVSKPPLQEQQPAPAQQPIAKVPVAPAPPPVPEQEPLPAAAQPEPEARLEAQPAATEPNSKKRPAPLQPTVVVDTQLPEGAPAPAAAAPRGSKRPRKQPQPTAAAAETPGGPEIVRPAAPKPAPAAARQKEADGAGPSKQAPEPKNAQEPLLRPAPPLASRAQAKANELPKKRGRPRKNPEAPDPAAATVAAGSASAAAAAPRPVSRATAAVRAAAKAAKAAAAAAAKAAAAATAAVAVLSQEAQVDIPELEDGEELAPALYDTKEAAAAAARRVGHRRPTVRRRRASDDDEISEEEEDDEDEEISDVSDDDTELLGEGSAGPRSSRGSQRTAAQKRSKKKALVTKKEPKERKKMISLADVELDPENWSMKDIVRWGNARERRIAMKERIDRQKAAAAAVASGEAPPAGPSQGGGGSGTPFGGYNDGPALPQRAPTLAPQVQIIDGRIVVNVQSLTVQAQERQENRRVVTEDVSRLNSMTYMNRLSNERWTAEDTELFYKALSQFGTDFTLISQLFPGRQRRHLKNKYTRENKLHPERVDEALRASANGTINSYKEMISMLKESGAGGSQPVAPLAGFDDDQEDETVVPLALEGAPVPLAITEAGEPPEENGKEEETAA